MSRRPTLPDQEIDPDDQGKAELLTAFIEGNVTAIRRSIASGETWDFVFPPAPYAANGSRVMQLEGRCRSPLALLVRRRSRGQADSVRASNHRSRRG